jgi:squalene-hopene/tetraprenyl-beta-curcumene cyclase
LLNNFKENNNRFFDRSVVGTGHRGLLNLQYPIYAYSFPLIALSRLNKVINGQYVIQENVELTNYVNEKLGIPKIGDQAGEVSQ